MAALSDRQPESVVELRRVAPDHLHSILEEEMAAWRAELAWDFQQSADLVRRFILLHALSGFALLRGGRMAGYSYYVCEEGKGLIGDLYVLKEHRTAET